MKKFLNIAFVAAMALGLAACGDDDVFSGIPVINPQQPIMPADGITASDAVAAGGSVDLSGLAASDMVTLLNFTELKNFPDDQELTIVMNASAKQDMSDSQQATLTVVDDPAGSYLKLAQIGAGDLDQLVKDLVSKDVTAQSLYVNYVAYAVSGTSSVLLGSVGAQQQLMVTPLPYEHPLENDYYLLAEGAAVSDATKLEHKGSLYDNPIWMTTLTISDAEIAAGGVKFMVIPASTKDAGKTWEQAPANTFVGAGRDAGTLAYSTADVAPEYAVITVAEAGDYTLSVDMLNLTYSVKKAAAYMYVPGNGNGWSFATRLATDDFIHFHGYAYLNGEFKFTGAAAWDSATGIWGAAAGNNYKLDPNGGNFQLDGAAGLYRLYVSMDDMTYTKTFIENIGVVGSLNGWNAGNPILLTPSSDMLTWEGEITLAANDEFKFIMNKGWGLNLGGAEDNLTQDGPNIKSPGAGTYMILLDLSSLPYQYFIEPAE